MKTKELVKILTSDGWIAVRQKGSHRTYKHPEKKGIVTVPIHRLSDEVRPGTLNSILKQAGLK